MARILIVEDELLIAMMLEDWVVELNHTPIGPARTVSEALALVGVETLDAAILDFHLMAETTASVALSLVEKQVPFAFATGGSLHTEDAQLKGIPTLSKPYDFETVRKMVDKLVGAKVSG